QAEHGDNGDECVSECVFGDDHPAWQAFGFGGANVVEVEDFEHAGSGHAGEFCSHSAAEGEGGKHEGGQADDVTAGVWQGLQREAEDDQEHWAEPEIGYGYA